MNAQETAWWCPHCRALLEHRVGELACHACGARYPVVCEVPDLHLQQYCDFDLVDDRRRVNRLLGDAAETDAATLLRRVFAQRDAVPANFVELRAADVLRGPARLAQAFDGWLTEFVPTDGLLLDLGCGPGQLLAAAARRGVPAVGIDISLEWLVVAGRLVSEHGGVPRVAAACGESERVLQSGGYLVMTTPNRYSLTPEPHVFLWGVDWLPRRWQRAYVRWRTGKPYEHVELRSSWGLLRLLRDVHRLQGRIVIPPVSVADARGSVRSRSLIDLYNRLIALPFLRPLFLLHGPLFQLTARKVPGSP